MNTVNANGKHLPKYMLVYSDMYDKIMNKYYEEDDILPSESKLQEQYGVSRITVRRAMEELQQLGLIEKQPGIGTRVISNKNIIDLNTLGSFSDENIDESSELINFEVIKAPGNIQMKLKLKTNDEVYRIERIRKVKESKIGLHCAYIPVKIIELSEEDFSVGHSSLYDILNENGIYLTTGAETIEAISTNNMLQNLLDVSDHDPILYKERTSFSNEIPVEFVRMYYRGDMYKYHIDLDNE
jgi:GntR family transcriptional regulator